MSQKRVVVFSAVLLLMVAVFFCQRGYVLAADIQPFSSDLVSHAAGHTENAKVYFSGDKIRQEIAGNVVIIRLDKNVMWMVMPSQQLYMEMPIDMTKVPQTSKEMEGEIEREPLGKEVVNGIQTEKFRIVSREGAVYQWLMDSGFPVKMEAVDGSWSVQYKNILFGPQPDYLFEVPGGLKKVSMPFRIE